MRLVEMLYKTNLFVMVGGDPIPKYPSNKVYFWDDYHGKFTAELTFKKDVNSIKLRQNKIAVATEDKVYIYKLSDLSLLTCVDTYKNNRTGSFCFGLNETLLGVIDKDVLGFFNIINVETKQVISKQAHSTGISLIEMSPKCDFIVTAADKGTLLRVFTTNDGSMIHEFRRGRDHVRIQTIAFSMDSQWLSCSSDNGKIDVFSLATAKANNTKKSPPQNSKSKFSFLGKIHPYFGSTWYYSEIDVSKYKFAHMAFLAIGKLQQLIAITLDGHWLLISYDNKQGNNGKIMGESSILASD